MTIYRKSSNQPYSPTLPPIYEEPKNVRQVKALIKSSDENEEVDQLKSAIALAEADQIVTHSPENKKLVNDLNERRRRLSI